MTSPRAKFGGASTDGAGRPQYENLKLDENGNMPAFRILPAMHSLAERNVWAVYKQVHYGYKGVDFKDKTKTRFRPFECVEEKDRRTEMISVSCAECRNIETKQREVADREALERAALKAQGVLSEVDVKARLKEALKPMNEWFKTHNLDRKWVINAVTIEGKLAVVRIPHKAKVALDAKIKELRAQGIEPITNFDSGVYFVIRRSGKFSDASFSVNVYMEQGANVGEMKIKWAPLSDDVLDKALKTLPDLEKDTTRRLTPQQVTMLVESGGDPDAVDTIFSMTSQRERSPSYAQERETSQQETAAFQASLQQAMQSTPAPAPVAQTQPTPPSPAPVAASAPALTEEQIRAQMEARIRAQVEAEMKAQMAAMQQKAPVAQPTPAPTPTPTMAVDPLDPNVPPEAFAAMFPKLPPR